MKTYEQLKKLQTELDSEPMGNCPKCGSPLTWWNIREVGCLECYYRETEKEGIKGRAKLKDKEDI